LSRSRIDEDSFKESGQGSWGEKEHHLH